MLSVLIPVYSYNIVPLVENLHHQLSLSKINFEIIALDDGSKSPHNKVNSSINQLEYCKFTELPNNLGRSAIRNLLSTHARFENLLFVDAGTYPKSDDFINTYLRELTSYEILIGGMSYLNTAPKKPYTLRWLYTKKRESKKGLHSCNFLIKKSIIQKHPFNESLKGYGYEDVLFFDSLIQLNYKTKKINNPVVHSADDNADTFIKKNETAIKNLIYLIENKEFSIEKIGVSRCYAFLERFKVNYLVFRFYILIKPLIRKNLNSSYPVLFLYDFYRLGYYCSLKNNS
ncbi:glycosyltransferase family 2 protein [Cognatitamlana onchidii]|uniref:glycosyltransferase family 2 protein n=1 Tax=Cognatitamlana onchidii TaxID=2562860 RepID=UPI0010A69FA4|nr:glycosyltransferase [Algibacter onchidii]